MADLQTMPTVHELLQWNAPKAYLWVVETQAQAGHAPEHFNWHGLAEIAAADALERVRHIATPRQRLPEVQQEALALTLSGEHQGDQALNSAAQAWLDKALPALNYARIAVTTYHFLADREGPMEGHSFINSAMTLRACLITRLGPLPGNKILDPDRITGQFLADFPLTPSEAHERAAWSKQQLRESVRSAKLVDTLLLLRRIKNALKPIASLIEGGTIQPSPTLTEWLAVRESLP